MRKILYRIILQIVENTDMARDVLKEIFKKKKKKTCFKPTHFLTLQEFSLKNRTWPKIGRAGRAYNLY